MVNTLKVSAPECRPITQSIPNSRPYRGLISLLKRCGNTVSRKLIPTLWFPTGRNRTAGRFTGSFRVPARYAWKFRSLEIRSATAWPALTLDIDDPDAYERLVRVVFGEKCYPGLTGLSKGSGTAISNRLGQLFVPFSGVQGRARIPCWSWAGLRNTTGKSMGGDHGFSGCLQHNPMSRPYRVGEMQTYWGPTRPYGLEQLKVVIPSGWRMPPEPTTECGRNVLSIPGRLPVGRQSQEPRTPCPTLPGSPEPTSDFSLGSAGSGGDR